MSNYKLARFPQDKYRFQVYDNVSRLSWQQIKAQIGCYALINLAYFGLTNFKPEDTIMVDGKWLYRAPWSYSGLLVDKDGKFTVGPDSAATWGYANGEPCYRLGGVDQQATHYAANGSTFVGVEADGTVVLLLAPKDKPITSREGIAALAGCRDILRYDGSWSTQGSLGPGLDVDPSEERIVRSYLLVFVRETKKGEDKPVDGIKQGIMTRSDCYKAGKTITPKGIMVHSTATPGAMAQALRDDWDKPGMIQAVHAFVDDQGIIQALPWNWRSWHAGDAAPGKVSANNTHISFEICEPAECRLLPIEWIPLYRGNKFNPPWAVARLQMELQARGFYSGAIDGSFGPATETALKSCQKALGLTADGSCGPATLAVLAKRTGSYLAYKPEDTAAYFMSAYGNAVALCATLCKQHGFDPMRDILCHSEGYKAGIASNHADVMHWFPQHGKSMDTFRADVAAAISGNAQPADPLGDAVDKLAVWLKASGQQLDSPDYWKGGNYSAANVQALIIKMAAAI